MSYAGIEPWNRISTETDEVYLWRSVFVGANIRTRRDMQAVAAAIGRGQGLGLNLQGIAVEPISDGRFAVDAVFASPGVLFYAPWVNDAEDIAKAVKNELAQRFPELSVELPHFEVINDDEPKHPALDFWLAHSPIWAITGDPWFPTMDKGQPTAAWGRFEGLYRGKAADGVRLKLWQDPSTVSPPGKQPGFTTTTSDAGSSTTLLWVLGAVVLFAVIAKPTGAKA